MATTGFWSGGLNDRGEVAVGVTFSGGLKAIIKATPMAVTISGHVNLLDYFGATMPTVDIELVGPGGESHPGVPLDPAGNFSFTTTRRGSYQVLAMSSHWLAQKIGPVSIWHSGASGLSFSLTNGDSDGDNEVGIGDYSILSGAYNTGPGDPDWDASADLNGDDAVDIGDYSILSANYGMVGDN